MIKELRDKYNREFSETRYNEFIEDLNRKNGTKIEFRIAETPIFLPNDLKKRIFKGIDDIVGTLTRSDYLSKVDKAVPSILMVPNETPYTETLSIDFAICKDDDGNLVPKLIEMQGFPSLYFYQLLLNREYREFFDIPGEMENYFSGLDEEGYIAKMRETIVGDTPDENVILLEIEKKKQKVLKLSLFLQLLNIFIQKVEMLKCSVVRIKMVNSQVFLSMIQLSGNMLNIWKKS